MPNPKTTTPTPQQALNAMAPGIYADRKAATEGVKHAASRPMDFNSLAASVYASRRGARA